ncbi:hypothetical protein IT575_00365 [bacterium]|nr:hypothetical protein [bacterium]
MRPSASYRCLLIALGLLACALLSAATDKATRIVNDKYHFAFTVEANSEISYQDGGVGLLAKHVPEGADATDPADYGLLVYGSPRMRLTPAEAEAAGFPREEKHLTAADLGSQQRLDEVFEASMAQKKHSPSGKASVKLAGSAKSISVPYYKWSQKVGAQTAYALMYIALHQDGLIYVQAESRKPFTAAQEKWFTTRLELLDKK